MKKKKLLYSAIVAVALALCVALCVGCGEKTENFSVSFKDGDTTVAEVVVESGATVKVPDYGKDGYKLVWMNGATSSMISTRPLPAISRLPPRSALKVTP